VIGKGLFDLSAKSSFFLFELEAIDHYGETCVMFVKGKAIVQTPTFVKMYPPPKAKAAKMVPIQAKTMMKMLPREGIMVRKSMTPAPNRENVSIGLRPNLKGEGKAFVNNVVRHLKHSHLFSNQGTTKHSGMMRRGGKTKTMKGFQSNEGVL